MFFNQNIRYLRKLHQLTQAELAKEIGLSRKNISAYEDRSQPKLNVLLKIAQHFNVSVDHLLTRNLGEEAIKASSVVEENEKFTSGTNLRVLSITVDHDNNENIELVPQKASAGYASGFADPEFLKELPKFQLPFLSANKTYRAFEVKGDSMLPLLPGSIVIGELVLDWNELREGEICVVIAKSEGVVLKKVYDKLKERNSFLLKSNNPQYPHFELPIDEIQEVWRYSAHIASSFPEDVMDRDDLNQTIERLKDEIYELNHQK
ncbi:XRE family transcriptional regulator [Sediminitomix flava]|uniref:Phage repressor protein C with HTH and peptisase S24 domain n=1 Tax=Sediminitomix flava TaxID=379075 RepID=A0A315ZBY4_SEDFL|nr:XRE family transcriptional regulator [Sediminitomix flava]PWJ42593.1 phage repressor protein C with HTH and peptisase S24 domain [Sediminitomix flava]